MATVGERPARSGLSVTLAVDSGEWPKVTEPPAGFVAVPRPVLVLPGGLRVFVDHASTHAAAADWWRRLAVTALYAANWHEAHSGDDN